MNRIHATALQLELEWLSAFITHRISSYFNANPQDSITHAPPPPDLPHEATYTATAPESPTQRLIFALALAPKVAPAVLDPFFTRNSALDRPFTEFGGLIGNAHGSFIPTIETALFLAAGSDLHMQETVYRELFSDNGLIDRQLVQLDDSSSTVNSRALVVPEELVAHLRTGDDRKADVSTSNPLQRLTTALEWNDLSLNPPTLAQIGHIRAWVENEKQLLDDWGLSKVLSPGYRALFYGPPGTGKTLAASLLGKVTNHPVYRINLAMLISKYIGETEKNLSRVFDNAAAKNCILFFDEADALFGSHSQTSSANDRYANQEKAYLMQRVEDHPGLIILAANTSGISMDAAFSRRFQSLVQFSRPNTRERLRIWTDIIDGRIPIDNDVSLEDIASEHELTGSEISNAVLGASLLALSAGNKAVTAQDLVTSIATELNREDVVT